MTMSPSKTPTVFEENDCVNELTEKYAKLVYLLEKLEVFNSGIVI